MRQEALLPDPRHDIGDHRHCHADQCDWAATYRPRALAAEHAALTRTGRALAILCLACEPDADGPKVLATITDFDLWSGKGMRNAHSKRGPHGNLYLRASPHSFKSTVLVVGLVDGDPTLF